VDLVKITPRYMGPKMVTFPNLLGYETCNGLQIQVKAVATILIIFGAHVNVFFIIKVKILLFIKRS
jgi:hypothetical protein